MKFWVLVVGVVEVLGGCWGHPSYVIHVRRDILEEVGGPMLRDGLQVRRISLEAYDNVTKTVKVR